MFHKQGYNGVRQSMLLEMQHELSRSKRGGPDDELVVLVRDGEVFTLVLGALCTQTFTPRVSTSKRSVMAPGEPLV